MATDFTYRAVTRKEQVATPYGWSWASPGEVIRSDGANNWILPELPKGAALTTSEPKPVKEPEAKHKAKPKAKKKEQDVPKEETEPKAD